MNLAVGKGNEAVTLEEIKDALDQEIGDDADVAAVVEAIAQMDAPVAIFLIVCLERGQDSDFNLGGVAVFLHGSDDFDGHELVALPVTGLNNLAKCALTQEVGYLV